VGSDLEVIKAIIDAFERSDWAEIDVRSGSLRVHLSTHAQPQASSTPAKPVAARAEGATSDDVGGAANPVLAPPPTAAEIPAGAVVVASPAPGIFWRSPSPGAPPFADVGDEVEAGATLCIVEVMKLMNHVVSDIAGTVVGIYADNGTRVDLGGALFAVEPTRNR
jgi:acetyl-CoA carboxylase biotin carboxyl carrier protein